MHHTRNPKALAKELRRQSESVCIVFDCVLWQGAKLTNRQCLCTDEYYPNSVWEIKVQHIYGTRELQVIEVSTSVLLSKGAKGVGIFHIT